MPDKTPKIPYHEQIANKLIEQLKAGTAPWQIPWEPGVPRMPHNPISGTRYKGNNAIWLAMQGRSDPRWMTYNQANRIDAQVMKGQKGTLVQYWKLYEKLDKKDENGNVVRDKDGKAIQVRHYYDKPRVFSSVVFNAEQIDGLPELEVKALPELQRHDRAERILQNSGVPIHHDQLDNAYYSPSTDSIHLPDKSQFPTTDSYLATVFHELGHSSGHESRLDRDMTGRFGDESYAKEELRAEIGSLMIGDELQIGHDFGQHAAYVDHWIKVLQDDPKEILRASRDAEKIMKFVMDLEHSNQQDTGEIDTSHIYEQNNKNLQQTIQIRKTDQNLDQELE